MNEPQRSATRDAFNKAADAMEAWRQQQIAALTEKQRALYDQACRNAEEREKAKGTELEGRKQKDILEAIRKRYLEKAEPAPRPPFGLRDFKQQEDKRAALGRADVEQAHVRELESVKVQERGKLDNVLRAFERARELRPELRQEFARAGVKDKARTDFKEAVTGQGLERIKSEAIARAIEKVRQKEQQEIARGDRDTGRERLTDTFNKVR